MSEPDGLADGDELLPLLEEPLEPELELGMLLEPDPLLPEPVLPEPLLLEPLLPAPVLELPDDPDGLLPEPLPLPVWAAASAGARAMVPTRRANTKFRM
jgi:hypothetical protein